MTITVAIGWGLGAFALGYCFGLFIQSLRKFAESI